MRFWGDFLAPLTCMPLPFFALSFEPTSLVVAVASAVKYSLEAAMVFAFVWVGWRLTRALENRTRELRASEERFRELFEHGIEGVYESDSEGGFRRVNPAMRRMDK